MKQKKELVAVQIEQPMDQLIVLPLNIFATILPNCSFKISKIYLTKKIFSEEFTETWKRRE